MAERERDLRLDSVKGLLIILVILGHIIGTCGKGVVCEDVWQIIYVFHMPLFILVSGFLTSIKKDTKFFWQSLSRIVISLIVFQSLFVGIAVVVFRNAFSLSYLYTPYWTLWYLLSLFYWRIMIQYTPKVLLARPYLYLAIATVVAVFCGLMPNGRIMSIQRTFNFFPFFLFGYYIKQGVFQVRLWPKYVSCGIIVIFIILIISKLPPPTIGYENSRLMLRGADHYTISEVPLKIYYLLLSFVVSISVFNLVPEIKLLSTLGKESMFYYLYHGLIIHFFLQHLVSHFHLPHSFLFMLLYLVGIMGLIFIMRRIKPFRWLISPTFSKQKIIKSDNK